jgi:hypothetical protein
VKTKTVLPSAVAPSAQIEDVLAYSVNDFCRVSSLGRSFVYEALDVGNLRSIKIGKRRLILAQDARAFLRGEPPASAA